MGLRGDRTEDQGFEVARSGTVYWTLSLYVEPDKVAAALGLASDERVEPAVFRRTQRRHLPSLALGNAVDPLMNDIADREVQGEVQEFLLAVLDDDGIEDLTQAAAGIRAHKDLIFKMPKSVSWTTEGVRFHAHPEGLDDDRAVRLRRFWMSHNDGALSYHLSFSHYYGGFHTDAAGRMRSGYDASTYYFLSLLQKLAAPKEYALDPALLKPTAADPDPFVDVFSETPLNIDPLDKIRIRYTPDPAPGGSTDEAKEDRFWPFVRTMFEGDAARLFPRIAAETPDGPTLQPGFERDLLELSPFVEAPGLKLPKSRFMFMLHDERFFDRLMPVDPETGTPAPRKRMVQPRCYEPYQDRIRALTKPISRRPPREVHLGSPEGVIGADAASSPDFWTWAAERPDYATALLDGAFVRRNPHFNPARTEGDANPRWLPISQRETLEARMKDLAAAMQAGDCVQIRGARRPGETEAPLLDAPIAHHVPAFELRRTDCLDYLFLAGFNQNIIDFMNQDTSEILDSIDPIYPESSEQTDERFFVRYANHRAMITYVPKSRSLEIGNDYIGACPYAFLIHALALHNEFLAREHERRTMARIERIHALVDGKPLKPTSALEALQRQEPLKDADPLSQAEMAINQAKLAEFDQYERYRHANPFRYDTERVVFAKLEELRGVSRKNTAMSLAIKSLEDHASDLSRRQQKKADEEAAKRGQQLNVLLGMTGVFGAAQMLYWIGEKTAGGGAEAGAAEPSRALFGLVRRPGLGDALLTATEVLTAAGLVIFFSLLIKTLIDAWRTQAGTRRTAKDGRRRARS